jgi:hypothetical protein
MEEERRAKVQKGYEVKGSRQSKARRVKRLHLLCMYSEDRVNISHTPYCVCNRIGGYRINKAEFSEDIVLAVHT